jgi:hypothetical protein
VSRSIHQTQRQLEHAERFQFADDRTGVDLITGLREALQTKHRVKRQVVTERHQIRYDAPPVSVDATPIRVLDANDWVHYPATPDDIRAVLRLLPVGMVDGLSLIEMCLGDSEQEDEVDLDRDPYTGRRGHEVLPGCYRGQVLGQYLQSDARIRLFGVVYDQAMANRRLWEVWLRLGMLATLVHEVGHHFDEVRRRARGRWRADQRVLVEIYAEQTEHDLIQSCVVPYLERTYPEQVAALKSWLHQYGGIELPLSVLAGDPRATARGGRMNVSSIFSLKAAVESLAIEVANGEQLVRTRTQFARDLHYADLDTEALAIIDRMIAEQTHGIGVSALQAHIYRCQKRYDLALPLALKVVEEDAACEEAWEVLADAYEAQADWSNVVQAVTRYLELREYRAGPTRFGQRARALIELGAFDDAEPDLIRLEGVRPGRVRRLADELRARIATLRAEPNARERKPPALSVAPGSPPVVTSGSSND